MRRVLGPRISSILRQYYCAPNHRMKLRIWRYLRYLLGYSRLTVPYMGNGWITLDERDYLQNMILRVGSYEPEVWWSLARIATANEIVWDVGANIGSFAISAMLDGRISKVHAFEPDPSHAEILTYNVGLNTGRLCDVHQCAIGDQCGHKNLLHATFPHTGGSTFIENPAHGRFDGHFSVNCLTVDALIDQRTEAPTLMKIDVEGWEVQVLKGAKKLLANKPPKAMVIECDSDSHGNIQNIEVMHTLEEFGYSVSWIRRPERDIFHRENYLATHKLRAAL